MKKTEVLKFRCNVETKKYVEEQAAKYNISLTEYMEKKILFPEFDADAGIPAFGKVYFGLPEQLGNNLVLLRESFRIYTPGERLTDTFLSEIIKTKNNPQFPVSFSFSDEPDDDGSEILLIFSDPKVTKIKYKGLERIYDISFDEFFNAFIANIQKYSLYYAAPANYKAMFYASFDTMGEKMQRYREKEKEILDKIKPYI